MIDIKIILRKLYNVVGFLGRNEIVISRREGMSI